MYSLQDVCGHGNSAGTETRNRKGRAKRRSGLSRLAQARLAETLRRVAPSEPWVDAQFIDVVEIDERGERVVRRAHDPSVFPPGGAQTAMVRCPQCGVITPPNAFENGICLDDADHGNWGPSPSAQAIAALQYRNLRLVEAELPPESLSALQAEIRREMGKASSVRRQPSKTTPAQYN